MRYVHIKKGQFQNQEIFMYVHWTAQTMLMIDQGWVQNKAFGYDKTCKMPSSPVPFSLAD